MVTLLKIGEIAKKTGVSVGTLRYYESLQLLSPLERGENNYRYYGPETIQQVEFIKKAQSLGFSLEEARQILAVKQSGEPPCELVKQLLAQKITELDLKIHQMTVFKAELENYATEWLAIASQNSDVQNAVCPLIASVLG
ncbi:heavy metal-responsive transcriptional regulator [Synechocystis sp. LKSZ1]|uniref:heavy metal-responsive transcriptional regulator n=1 Tax=Synechocystis sp. LKSZ1 TaxID=3144951 RepID=UPI00336BEAF8